MNNLKKEVILNDLSYYKYDKNMYINLSDDELNEFYINHIKNNFEEVNIEDIFTDENKNLEMFIDTPDGPQLLGDLVIKEHKEIYKVVLCDDSISRSSNDHLYQTQDGWKFAKDLLITDLLLTKKSGFITIKSIHKEELLEDTYDFEVMHENHRYWGNGISSHNTGKTFLALNMVREAIKMGYDILWLDSEAAVDKQTFEKFGLDTEKIYYQPAQTIKQAAGIIANSCAMIKEKMKKGFEVPKLYVVLDSIGNLSSGKEREDILAGADKRDMTKQQELGGMFRVITTDIASVGGMFLCTNHTYDSIGGYIPTTNIKGGNASIYNCSIILVLTKANLKSDAKTDGKENAQLAEKSNIANRTGIIVTSKPYKNRFAKPIPIKFHISFFKGMNPYVGLEDFISWKTCGIQRGTYEEEILEKPVLDEQGNQVISRGKVKIEKINTGNMIFVADENSKGWAVKHLNRMVLPHEFFTNEVFTLDVLKQLDERVIKPLFELPEIMEHDEIFEELGLINE